MSKVDSHVLSGTFPVVPSPFAEDDQFDEQSFRSVVNYMLHSDVDGLVFPGLASEYAQLSEAERLRATAIVGELTRNRVPFVVGAGATTPEQAIRYAVAGAEAGACCAMVMAPAQFAEDWESMVAFYRQLAGATGIPVMLQNAPQPMGAGLPVEKVLELVKLVPQIEYVKEETMPYGQRIEYMLTHAPSHLKGVFGGAGGRYIMDELKRGALGTMPASELTEVHVALVKAYRSGDTEKARELFVNMLPILNMQAVFRCSLTKQVLHQRGIVKTTRVRVPGPQMRQAENEELTAFWPLVEPIMGPLDKLYQA